MKEREKEGEREREVEVERESKNKIKRVEGAIQSSFDHKQSLIAGDMFSCLSDSTHCQATVTLSLLKTTGEKVYHFFMNNLSECPHFSTWF